MLRAKGYYRSAYPASAYASLVSVHRDCSHAAERISLIGDEWAQVRSNKAKVGDYLDLAAELQDATRTLPVVSSAAGRRGSDCAAGGGDPEEKAAMAHGFAARLRPELAKLGPPSAATRRTRAICAPNSLSFSANFGKDPGVLAQASRNCR
jgi:hypothetical protein